VVFGAGAAQATEIARAAQDHAERRE
jgi:hypothetical protein